MKSRFFIRFFLFLSLVGSFPLAAQQIDDFYIPLPEAEALDFFTDINTGAGTTLITRTDIVIRESGTEIVYDPFADGYETDYDNEGTWAATTERWGDQDCTNGFNPNLGSCTGTQDVFTIGEVLIFSQADVSARDYFRSNETVNTTRSLWPNVASTLLAGAFELFPTSQWGTQYVVPIGEGGNITGAGQMFQQIAVTILAREDGTNVEFDPDGPGGAAPIVTTLNRGETVDYGIGGGGNGQALSINVGATVTSTAPVQVNVLSGDIGSNFEARFYTLFPNSLLSDTYYEAVGTTQGDDPAATFIYNPTGSAILVDVYNNTAPTTIASTLNVAANTAVKFSIPAATAQGLTGIRFESRNGEIFSAYTVVDDNGQDHDWGHVVTPLRLMGDTIRVGFAPGRDPLSASNQNASPVWVVADVPGQGTGQNIEICVDAGGNGGPNTDNFTGRTYDYSFVRQPLDSTRLYDNGVDGGSTNNNGGTQTGLLAFACDPNNDGNTATPTTVIMAAAWGQDPQRASAGSPGFDVGTTIRTSSRNNLFIGDLIFQDPNGNGIQDLGEVGIAGAIVRIDVTDPIANPGIDVDPLTAGVQSFLEVTTDASGLYLFSNLTDGIEYTITVTPGAGLQQTFDPDGTLDNTTTLTLLSSTLDQDFGYAIVLDIDKTSATAGSPVDPGDTIPYTIVVTNNTSVTATNVEVTDTLPAGVTYVPGTSMKTYPAGALMTGSLTTNFSPLPLAVTGIGTQSQSVDTTGTVPAGATLTDYEVNVQGATNGASWLSEINLQGITPGGPVFAVDFGADLGQPDAGGAYNQTLNPAAPGSAVGVFQLNWSEDFNDGGGTIDQNVTTAQLSIDYQFTTAGTTTDAAGDPGSGTLVSAGEGINLAPGESMTIVFDVTVDSPFIHPSTLVNNTAVISDQTLVPSTDDATDEVREDDGSIAGRVWLDEDQDGINDIEEAGLTSVSVELQDGVCTPSVDCPVVETDQNGNYIFADLPAGNYTVVVFPGTLPPNLTNTAGPFGLASRSVSLADDENVTDEDFGYIANPNTGAIGDRVWSDADGDGVQDFGEAGLAGVTLRLLDANGVQVGAPVTTNANGDYLFTGVPFGEDYVVEITDTGAVLTGFTPTVGPQSEGGTVSNPVTLTPALTTVTDVDFGFDSDPNVTITITDRVWYDSDRDTTQDPGEPGIPNVTVNLLDGSGNLVATTITDGNGDFTFSGVPEGSNYSLVISDLNNELAGLTETTATGGDETIVGSLTIAAGDGLLDTVGDDGTPTFGYNNPGSIAGTVWSDADSNEVQNGGESGIGGVTVTLTPPAGVDLGNGDGQPISTITAPDGSYLFNDLPPGNYSVDILPADQPAGIHTEDPDSDDDNNVSITLGVGEGVRDQDFGYVDATLFDVSGTVFKDTDKDGVEEPDGNDGVNGNLDDEPGFPAVTLDLIDCGAGTCDDGDEAVIASTTTDANGDYSFPGLPDGEYQVAVTDTDGQVAGYDITSGLDVLPVTVAGADVVDVDFGYIKDEATGSIAGEVWIDEALINGLADDPETNLAGVTVYLCDAVNSPCTAGDALATTVTDANGEYVFNNLPSGQYVVDSDPATIPGGLDLTVDPAPVSLSEGENVTDVDIGYEPAANTGVLSGFVWTDVNSDGIYDPAEAPIGGVDIFVYSTTDNPGTLTLIATGTTAPNGRWIVSGISGSDLQDGLLITYDDADIPAGLESAQPTNLPLGDDLYNPVDLLSDEDNNISYLDFAFPPGVGTDLGSISGTIYSDTNQDADYVAADDGELRGVTVSLLDGGGNVILSTKTDDNGFYIFDGLVDGTYSVVVSDSDNVLQDLNPLEVISNPIVIAGGADITDQDAGYISDPVLGSIGNLFFLDLNDNGIADLGEPGIQGVVVQCWVDTNFSATPNVPVAVSPTAPAELPELGIDNLVRTVTTDENGEYYCTSLPTGQYIVRVFSSLDFNEADDGATVNVGTTAADDNNAKPWVYALTTASPNLRADFGVRGSNLISGTVFIEDEALVEPDGNGAIDPGVELDGVVGGPSADVPVQGVVVVLYRQNPDGTFSEVRRRPTNGSGNYQFAGLPDGTYRVEVLPNGSPIDGFGQTGDPDLAAVAANPEEFVCDSSTAALCDDQTQVVLAGSDATGLDFGYQKNFTTTPVTINAFSSEGNGGTVTFSWQTSNEVGHLGYQLFAREAEAWVLLNDELIASPSSGDALQTRNYEYTAYGVEATWFALIDVSVNEELTVHGPYKLGESYGAEADDQPAFDWSSVSKPGAASPAEQQRSVMDRVRRLRALDTANDDEYEDAEEIDALESSAHSGGQE